MRRFARQGTKTRCSAQRAWRMGPSMREPRAPVSHGDESIARHSNSILGRLKSSPVLLSIVAALPLACHDADSGPVVLGGVSVSAEELALGKTVFLTNCSSCHGESGAGDGTSAAGMNPPPRNFRLGVFKYVSPPKSSLPTDADLLRTIRKGLPGTHMPAWASLHDDEATAVAHYVKSFSKRWEQETPAPPIALGNDPWLDDRAAMDRGETLYHGKADCLSCHPAYAPHASILRARANTMSPTERARVPLRDSLHISQPAETIHGTIVPPDFLLDEMKVSRDAPSAAQTIAAGIGGTPMPSFHLTLSHSDIWALAHYVRSLASLRGTPRARALRLAAHPPSLQPTAP